MKFGTLFLLVTFYRPTRLSVFLQKKKACQNKMTGFLIKN